MGRSRGLVAPVQRTTASKFLEQFLGGIIFADFGVANELDAFGFQLLDAAQDDFLLVELHVGDAVHQQTAGAVGAFENGDQMAGPVQLGRGAEAGGTGTDDGDFLAGARFRAARARPSRFPSRDR